LSIYSADKYIQNFNFYVYTAYLPKENEEDYEKLKKDMPEIFDCP
jgi:hypothetical protein